MKIGGEIVAISHDMHVRQPTKPKEQELQTTKSMYESKVVTDLDVRHKKVSTV